MSKFRYFPKFFTAGNAAFSKNIKVINTKARVCLCLSTASAFLYTGYLYESRKQLTVSSNFVSRMGIIPPSVLAATVYDKGIGSGNKINSNDDTNNKTLSQKNNFIADVVEKIAPAVVFIEIQGRHPFSGAAMTVSNGSGFIVREDGLIITSAHVVANYDRVVVKLNDGREFNGKVQTIENVSDLATIKIDCKNLPVLKFGNSNTIRPGEWVVAMGSPLSLSNTITAGVVSSVHRESRELGIHHHNMEYIQTDAAITFGNSGGPLVNLDGEVIGINTMKVTAGISFAVPSNIAAQFLKASEERIDAAGTGWFGFKSKEPGKDSLVSKRRYMGITMLSLTPNIILEFQQKQENFPRDLTHGVLIWKVVIGSPAYNGGLYPGDVVTEINGKIVKSTADVYNALESADKLDMVILRNREKLKLSIHPQNS